VDDTSILLDFKATVYDDNNNILSNLIVYLKDENRKLVKTETTDATGKITFGKLLTDQSYIIEFNEEDSRLSKIKKIIIKSADGKIVKEIYRNEQGFEFHILKGEENQLTDIYVNDPWLTTLDFKNKDVKQEIVIEEKLFYAYGEHSVDETGTKVLDKVIKIMKDNPDITCELTYNSNSASTYE